MCQHRRACPRASCRRRLRRFSMTSCQVSQQIVMGSVDCQHARTLWTHCIALRTGRDRVVCSPSSLPRTRCHQQAGTVQVQSAGPRTMSPHKTCVEMCACCDDANRGWGPPIRAIASPAVAVSHLAYSVHHPILPISSVNRAL